MRAVLAAILLLSLTLPAVAAPEPPVNVRVDVTLLSMEYKSCDVVVPRNSTGGDALDAAVATGCLDEWTAGRYDGLGRYVVSIDRVQTILPTYWAMSVNGTYSDLGMDLLRLHEGHVLSFDYRCWACEVRLP
ncbi:MAG TPA: DUF4430 domain-containing protein [Candidatus Thermoplasmatota archaeon]|nr:DUF4430 domain-containing protein [Candidatus Thermoplasmatota archaeon]